MDFSTPPPPPLTFLPSSFGSDYFAIANHFKIRFNTASTAQPLRWQCWEVDAQFVDDGRPAGFFRGTQAQKPPGGERILLALKDHFSEQDGWIYDKGHRLYVREDKVYTLWSKLKVCETDILRVSMKPAYDGQWQQQLVDLGRVGTTLEGDCSEEQRFLHVYLRDEASRKKGCIVSGRKVFFESHEPRLSQPPSHHGYVQGRSMWLAYLANLEQAAAGESNGCMQLNVNVTAGFGIHRQSLQHFIGALQTGERDEKNAGSLHWWWLYDHTQNYRNEWATLEICNRAREDWRENYWERYLDVLNSEQFGIKHVEVEALHMRRGKSRIRQISLKPPCALWFEYCASQDSSPVWTNVEEYFLKKHNKKLEYPWLPCVDIGKTPRKDWVPIEFLMVCGGKGNLTRKLTDKMLEVAVRRLAVRPEVRLQWIQEMLWSVPNLQNIGAEVDWNPLSLTCRKLEGLALQGGSSSWSTRAEASSSMVSSKVEFKDGFFNLASDFFAINPPKHKIKWMILNYAADAQHELRDLATSIPEKAKERGFDFDENPYIEWMIRDERRETESRLSEYFGDHWNNLHVVVVVFPKKSHVYSIVKAATFELGLHSACLEALPRQKGRGKGKGGGTGGKGKEKTLTNTKVPNMVHKLLTKLGTVLQLENPHPLLRKGTLVLGADVRHDDGGPSLAGLVGASEPFTQYWSSCRAQMPRLAQEGERQRVSKEHIEHIEEMGREILRHYQKKEGAFPERVLMFRDGISQGQFLKLSAEIVGISQAFTREGNTPQLAWIVVQKRHQTRLFPGKDEQGNDEHRLPNGNVLPGVVADRDIANPAYENWFGVSHRAIQGTAVPPHYTLLHNSIKDLEKKDFVQVSHELCHLCPHASSAVSCPTPAKYADHLCEFAHHLGLAKNISSDVVKLNQFFKGRRFADNHLQGSNFFC